MGPIEPTSGNTGIALAMIAAVRGYAIEAGHAENATAERVDAMRAFGAEVIHARGARHGSARSITRTSGSRGAAT
jgi:cysteine synthase B